MVSRSELSKDLSMNREDEIGAVKSHLALVGRRAASTRWRGAAGGGWSRDEVRLGSGKDRRKVDQRRVQGYFGDWGSRIVEARARSDFSGMA